MVMVNLNKIWFFSYYRPAWKYRGVFCLSCCPTQLVDLYRMQLLKYAVVRLEPLLLKLKDTGELELAITSTQTSVELAARN